MKPGRGFAGSVSERTQLCPSLVLHSSRCSRPAGPDSLQPESKAPNRGHRRVRLRSDPPMLSTGNQIEDNPATLLIWATQLMWLTLAGRNVTVYGGGCCQRAAPLSRMALSGLLHLLQGEERRAERVGPRHLRQWGRVHGGVLPPAELRCCNDQQVRVSRS